MRLSNRRTSPGLILEAAKIAQHGGALRRRPQLQRQVEVIQNCRMGDQR